MGPIQPILRWVRASDRRVPRFIRLLRRTEARIEARRRNGSITAYMDAVVAEANQSGRP
jgi:hypothetical protein